MHKICPFETIWYFRNILLIFWVHRKVISNMCAKKIHNYILASRTDHLKTVKCKLCNKKNSKCCFDENCVLQDLTKSYFVCDMCKIDFNGQFSFESGLKRLSSALHVSVDDFVCACWSEYFISNSEQIVFEKHQRISTSLSTDYETLAFLDEIGGVGNFRPIATPSDGACLFHSVSIALTGHTGMSNQLRYFTAIEIGRNHQFYKRQFRERNLFLVSLDFEEECKLICNLYGWSGAWTLMAISSVVKRDIVSVYPHVNGPLDRYARLLDTIFTPIERKIHCSIYVVWTCKGNRQRWWTANHFVPLIEMDEHRNIIYIDEGNVDDSST